MDLLKGKFLSVGMVIEWHFRRIIEKKKATLPSIPYPGAIRRLCSRAGVDLSQFRMDLPTGGPIYLPNPQPPRKFKFRRAWLRPVRKEKGDTSAAPVGSDAGIPESTAPTATHTMAPSPAASAAPSVRQKIRRKAGVLGSPKPTTPETVQSSPPEVQQPARARKKTAAPRATKTRMAEPLVQEEAPPMPPNETRATRPTESQQHTATTSNPAAVVNRPTPSAEGGSLAELTKAVTDANKVTMTIAEQLILDRAERRLEREAQEKERRLEREAQEKEREKEREERRREREEESKRRDQQFQMFMAAITGSKSKEKTKSQGSKKRSKTKGSSDSKSAERSPEQEEGSKKKKKRREESTSSSSASASEAF